VLVLVELNVVEQRYQAVLEVLNQGASVMDAARRNGVTRQTVHSWLRRYASHGLPGLADGSAKPLSCPHQMTPEVEARVVMIRREHPPPISDEMNSFMHPSLQRGMTTPRDFADRECRGPGGR